jgi:hypothetical protein
LLRCILKKLYEFNLVSYLLFTDFKLAYDSVNIIHLYENLNEFGIPPPQKNIVKSIKMMLQDPIGTVKFEGQLTEVSDIESSFRQGDALSTILFNMLLDS